MGELSVERIQQTVSAFLSAISAALSFVTDMNERSRCEVLDSVDFTASTDVLFVFNAVTRCK
jgi:hypothetical protein